MPAHMAQNKISSINLPSMYVTVARVQSAPLVMQLVPGVQQSQKSRVHLGMLAQQFISNDDIGHLQTSMCLVPFSADQIQVESNLIPTKTSCVVSSVNKDATILPPQTGNFDTRHQLSTIPPGVRVKIYVITPAETAQLQVPTQAPTQAPTPQTFRTTHLWTTCVPLKELLPQLSTHGFYETQIVTAEDNNATWLLQLSLTDAKLQQNPNFQASMHQQLDLVNVHEGIMKSTGRPCEPIPLMVQQIIKDRELRKTAMERVINTIFPPAKLPVTWELQMSRSLGSTPSSDGTMKGATLDSQEIEFLRNGAAAGKQSEQNFLLICNSLASVAVDIAQQAGVVMNFDYNTQMTKLDNMEFHKANTNFVKDNGRQILVDMVMKAAQANMVSQSEYGNDPAYTIQMQPTDVHFDANGCGHVDFKSKLILDRFKVGEDQSIVTGLGPMMQRIFDCEDFANELAQVKSTCMVHTRSQFVQSVRKAISLLPIDLQQVSATIEDLASDLHTHIYENNRKATEMPQKEHNLVQFPNLNMSIVKDAITQAQYQDSFYNISCCSLLAKAPQIACEATSRTQLLSNQNNPNQNHPNQNHPNQNDATQNDATQNNNTVTLGNFFTDWSDQSSGLNGHSVCQATEFKDALWTSVPVNNNTNLPVNIRVVCNTPQIYEGTGVARQSREAASQLATLDVINGCFTPQRLLLQQKLDAAAKENPLNTIMASNVTSSLHSVEITQALSNNVLTQQKLAFAYGRSLMSTSLQPGGNSHEIVKPCVNAIQSFSLDAGDSPLTHRQATTVLNSMFYWVGLSLGDLGSCYSVKGEDHSKTQSLALTDPEQIRAAIIQNAPLLPGICFMKGSLFEPHAKIAVASPLNEKTKERLFTLGGYLALNQFDGKTYVECTPTVTPLFFRQALTQCPLPTDPSRQMWVPLSSIQTRKMETLSRGLFAKGYLVHPENGIKYTTGDEICANMNTIYQNACQVTGVCPVIKGTGFSNASMLVY